MPNTNLRLGPLVRLEGISLSQLPNGGKGIAPTNAATTTSDDASSTSGADLKTFLTSILTESIPFIDGVAPKAGGSGTWKAKGSPKTLPHSKAPVHLFEYSVSGKDLDKLEGMKKVQSDRVDETWFCRRSCHEDAAEDGTASWAEFVHSFKEHHAESEEAFTPTVIGARMAMEWETTGLEIEAAGERWTSFHVVVEEMKHKIDPKPLKNRTFPVIQIAAMSAAAREFMVVSIPVNDFRKSPYAEYAHDKSLVVAAYASIERIRILPSNGEIEWIMATASDAGGVLPQWMQNLAVPSAVAKDVEFFLSWIPSQRHGSAPAVRIDRTAPTAPVGS